MRINPNRLSHREFERIRRTMFNTSSITSENRIKFRRLPFSEQANVISMCANAQLKLVDKLISKHTSGDEPSAAYLWFRLRAKAAEYTKIDAKSDLLMIKRLYPQLADVSTKITQLFTNTFTYIVDNFYSCDSNGKPNLYACMNSKARALTGDEMKMIDEVSGMAYLGQFIKKYADMVLLKNFPESYKSES